MLKTVGKENYAANCDGGDKIHQNLLQGKASRMVHNIRKNILVHKVIPPKLYLRDAQYLLLAVSAVIYGERTSFM